MPNRAKESSKDELGPVLSFMQLLWATEHALNSASKRMHAALGVTGLQRLVVRIVGQRRRVSAGELADVLRVHPSTLTGVLDKLVRARALTRETDPEDGRRAYFELDQRGKEIDSLRKGTVEAAVSRALSSLPQKKIAAAREVLLAVAGELERRD